MALEQASALLLKRCLRVLVLAVCTLLFTPTVAGAIASDGAKHVCDGEFNIATAPAWSDSIDPGGDAGEETSLARTGGGLLASCRHPSDFVAPNKALIEFAENNRATGFASEYTSPAGNRYYDITSNRGAIDADGPLGVGHHGGCSEIGCLLQAVEAEGPAGLGGSMQTIRNRPPNSPIPPGPPSGLGTPGTPCPMCEIVLDANGVSY